MLTKTQYAKLQQSGLSPSVINQVVQAAGGYEKPRSVEGFLGNVGKSLGNAVGGMGSSLINVFNPDASKNTLVNTAKLGVGAAQLLDPTKNNQISRTLLRSIPGAGSALGRIADQNQEQVARDVGSFYDQRYGVSDALRGDFASTGRKIGNTAYNDPVGFGMDISTVLGGAGALAKGAGATRAGRVLTGAGALADPITMPMNLIGNRLGKATRGLGVKLAGGLDAASESVLTRGYGQPQKLRKIEGVAGRSAGNLIRDYNLFDRNPESIGKAIDQVGEGYNSAIMGAGKNIDTGKFMKAIDEQIRQLDSQALLSDAAKSQRNSLLERRANLERYLSQDGAVPLQFSPQQAVQMKRNIYQDVKPSTFNPSYQGSGSQLAAKDAYRGLISSIDEAAPGTRQLGRDQAALIQLQELAENAQARGGARQNINFSKLGTAGLGGVLGGVPGAAFGYVAEQVANSPQALRAQSAVLKGASKVVGSKIPGKITTPVLNTIGNGYQTAKAARLVTPETNSKDTQTGNKSQIPRLDVAPKPPAQKSFTMDSIPPQKMATPKVAKLPSYKAPKNPFKSTAAFGKSFKLKSGSFN